MDNLVAIGNDTDHCNHNEPHDNARFHRGIICGRKPCADSNDKVDTKRQLLRHLPNCNTHPCERKDNNNCSDKTVPKERFVGEHEN